MKVISIRDVADTDREVHCPRNGFISYRLLLAKDGMGFSLHRTVVPKGDPQRWHYKNHLEACYCEAGHGLLTHCASGRTWEILPGTLYALDDHDDHSFQALEDTVLISVFNPPIVGTEVHGADGSYPVGGANG